MQLAKLCQEIRVLVAVATDHKHSFEQLKKPPEVPEGLFKCAKSSVLPVWQKDEKLQHVSQALGAINFRKTASNQLIKNNLTNQQIKQLKQLPVDIENDWQPCVAGHIQQLGFDKVLEIAARAVTKRSPLNYLMKALSRERYAR